jgi:hypothetical protein
MAVLDCNVAHQQPATSQSLIKRLAGDHYAGIQARITAWHNNLADKYAVTLHQLEFARDDGSARLARRLKELGYE